MYLIELIRKQIVREKLKSLILIMASLIFILFLGFYEKGIKRQEKELELLYDTIDVDVSINRMDSMAILDLTQTDIDAISETADLEVKDVTITVPYNCYQMCGENPDVAIYPQEEYLVENRKAEIITYDEQYLVGKSKINLQKGDVIIRQESPLFSFPEAELFLYSSREAVISVDCGESKAILVDESEPIERPEGIDTRTVLLKRNKINENLEQAADDGEEVGKRNVFVPYEWLQNSCNSLQIPYQIAEVTWQVKNKRNTAKVRDVMENMDLFQKVDERTQEQINQWGYVGYQFRVWDGVLLEATEPVEQVISVMKIIYRLLFILVLVISLILSYLTSRFETRSLYLMKMMGCSWMKRFLWLFMKQMLLCLIGVGLGYLMQQPKGVLSYLLCYMAGCIISILTIGRKAQQQVE